VTEVYCFGQCDECGLGYINPLQPDDDPTVAGADSIRTAVSYNEQMVHEFAALEAAAEPIAPKRLNVYTDWLGRPPQSLLDVGCGSGAFCRAFTDLGIAWAGIDVNAEMVAFAQDKGLPVEHMDLTRMDGSERFDVVYFSQVLEHILDPHAFLQAAYRLLRPGGIIHLDVPNHNSLTARIRKLMRLKREFGFLQPPNHLIAYSQPSIRHLFEATPFEILFLEAVRNDDPALGQTLISTSFKKKLVYQMAGLFGGGSLLSLVARKPSTPSSQLS